jgi:LmbE family N-acetylglucosaminyl deacetylase
MFNLARGDCGTATLDYETITRMRWEEAQASATIAGASIYPPIVDDLQVLYESSLIAKAASLIRRIKPEIVLLPSPQDYMEDHSTAARIGVTAAFSRGMINFHTDPAFPPWEGNCTIYHALPYGLRDSLGKRVRAQYFVDVSSTMKTKRAMLGSHKSQREWLDLSQGPDSYLAAMESMARQVGVDSSRFTFAEGWRRHSFLGFCAEGDNPLINELVGLCIESEQYKED